MQLICGAVAELADAADLKSADRDILWVRSPPALQKKACEFTSFFV